MLKFFLDRLLVCWMAAYWVIHRSLLPFLLEELVQDVTLFTAQMRNLKKYDFYILS